MIVRWLACVGCWLLLADAVCAQEPAIAPGAEKPPPGLKRYLGREIPEYMSHLGASWLTRGERQQEENAELMRKQLGLKPGMVVCDMGCGNGYHTLPMAKMVAPAGKVYAVDIQPEMLRLLQANAETAQVTNVELILGRVHDPKLPEGKLDLILLVDVYHEFSHPVQMLAAMRKSLKPDGRIALVEYRLEDPKVPIKLLHKMTKQQITKEMNANGLKLVHQFDELPWQHLMFFGRDETWSPAEKSGR